MGSRSLEPSDGDYTGRPQVKIWVEEVAANDPSWPKQYMLSEVTNYWDDPIEVDEMWWQRYKTVARTLSDMQLEAAKMAGYEND